MIKATLPLPQGLSFNDWASLLVEALSGIGVPQPSTEDRWREWACQLLVSPELVSFPTPDGFAGWREWAERASEAL